MNGILFHDFTKELIGDDGRACAIKTREPCQMGNQAALSGDFNVLRITRPEPFISDA